jgi:hypothetical protein
MADHRTVVTELVTGLGTLGFADLDEALAARPGEMASLSPEQWDLLDDLHRGGGYRQEFMAAWQNGRAFLDATDGLRGRRPVLIEWRGGQRQPGDEPVPADLRIDHVYLVSCKYLSQIVTNSSPAAVFDRLLAGGHGGRSADWFAEAAPDAYHQLYRATVDWLAARSGSPSTPAPPTSPPALVDPPDAPIAPVATSPSVDAPGSTPATLVSVDAAGGPAPTSMSAATDSTGVPASGSAAPVDPVRALPIGATPTPPSASVGEVGGLWAAEQPAVAAAVQASGADGEGCELPASVVELTNPQRAALQRRLGRGRWAPELRPAALAFSCAVAEASAARWRASLAAADLERVLWRLLRIGAAPYFVLGASAEGSLRIRIGTAWDWRQHFRLDDFVVTPTTREQPVVDWAVTVTNRRSRQTTTVAGHVEIRWSHGKFAQPPEAKVYLDTPHEQVPGYWPLA